MTRRELESLSPGDPVRIRHGVGTVLRVDVEHERVVVSFGGHAWVRDRKLVDLPRGGLGISVRGGSEPTCPECGRDLHGYRGPLCRYCDPGAYSE